MGPRTLEKLCCQWFQRQRKNGLNFSSNLWNRKKVLSLHQQVKERFGPLSLTLLADQHKRHPLDIGECVQKAVTICGLIYDSSEKIMVQKPFPKIPPVVRLLEAEVHFESGGFVQGFEILEELISRDNGNQDIRNVFISRTLEILKRQRVDKEEVKLDTKYLTQTAASFVKDDLVRLKQLMEATKPLHSVDNELWARILDQLSSCNSLALWCAMVSSSLYLFPMRKPDQYAEALKTADLGIQNLPKEDVAVLISYVIALFQEGRPTTGRCGFWYDFSFDGLSQIFQGDLPFKSFFGLVCGIQNPTLSSCAEAFSGLIEVIVREAESTKMFQRMDGTLYPFFRTVLPLIQVYPDFVWSLRSQFSVFSLIHQLAEDRGSLFEPIVVKLQNVLHLIRLKDSSLPETFDSTSIIDVPWFEDFDIVESLVPRVRLQSEQTLEIADLRKLEKFASFAEKSESFKGIQSLKVVHLNNKQTGISDEGAMLIARILASPHCAIRTVDLSKNHVGDDGCFSLLKAIADCDSKLEELDLSFNLVTDSVVNALLQTKLKSLRLGKNCFSQDAISRLSHSNAFNFEVNEEQSRIWTTISRDLPATPFEPESPDYYYKGHFDEDDKRDGLGSCVFGNGDKYVGEWKAGKKNGKGTEFLYGSGQTISLHWTENGKSGNGVLVLPNDKKVEIEFVGDVVKVGGVEYDFEQAYVEAW
eukprot:TRINITY_DN23353_c0_g1_i2.p1 TRINITY_DN23353_c0_g1~~TRINITY_DN23353_c0_g1_i2.p1  ORF type:complete len:700 (+),score=147.85 TRINITY_DN23353_c0_g1_i2:526-2625(+)